MTGRGRAVHRRRRIGPFAQTEVVDHVVRANGRTPEDEWRLIEMTRLFSSGVPISEIGVRFGVSRQRAQQLLDAAGVARGGCS